MLVNITVLNTRTIQRADPSLIPNAVEECLRFETSVPTWRQMTAKATKIGDIELPEGARLYAALCSANHDEAEFENPEKLDVQRKNAKNHLAFGSGRHVYLGNHMARLEMRLILEELTRRLPHMQLIEGQPWTYSPKASQRGPEHVLVTWDPAQNPIPEDRP